MKVFKITYRRHFNSRSVLEPMYRVSIKSLSDYKHLLQENHVEYKHIFFFKM